MLHVLLLAAAVLRGPDPQFFTPRPADVTITRDTVWFRAHEWHNGSPVSTCYVVPTRSWCPLSRVAFARASQATLSPQFARLIRKARRPADDSASAWMLHRGTLWVAFPGFESEGESQRGSLAAIDTTTGRVIRYVHRTIDSHRVSQIAAEGTTLWLATVRDGEYGQYGESGVVRVDLAGPTPRFSPNQQRSPEQGTNEVERIAAANGVLAIMANAGLAVRLPDGRWEWRYWQLGITGDLIGHTLALKPEYNPDNILLLTVATMRLTRPGPVARAFKLRGISSDNPDGFSADSLGRTLLAAGVLPIIRETVIRGDSLHPAVLAAAGLSGDRGLVPFLQRRLGSRDVEAALALVRLGDSSGVAHFRRSVREAQRGYFGIDYSLRAVLSRATSPAMVRMILQFYEKGIQTPGSTTVTTDGDPVTLSFEVAGELLTVLDEMNITESRSAAETLRRRFPSLSVRR